MTRLAILLFASLLPLAAQSSSLQGTVVDMQGASIPTAIVTATNQGTSASRKVVADDSGAYSFPQLQPGTYSLEVQKPGFATYKSEVRLQVNVPATVTVQLEVGQTSDTVNVSAEALQVNTQDATIGNPFTEQQVRELPLQTRNVVALLSLQPGVAPTGEVMGAKKDQNNITLDGVDANDNQNSGVTTTNVTGFNSALPVPLDSVQEFRTTVAGQGADQGRSSGGQVSLVTKSGTNQFHGSAYEYMRNTLTAANNWFSNRVGLPRQALVRNQYGASLGGRLIRDRAFFFFNWEDRKDRSATSQSRTVPSESFKQGIIKVALSNGQIATLSPADVKAIDPLHIGMSSYMLNYLQQYPVGNDPLSSADKGLNYSILRFNAPQTLNNRAYVGKMDFNLDRTGKHVLSVRGTLNGAHQDSTLAQFPGQSAAQQTIDNSRGLAARYTWLVKSNLVNVFNYGYTRIGLSSTGSQAVIPTFFTSSPVNVAAAARPSLRISPTTNLVDDLTWTKGKHSVQFGFNIRNIENDRVAYNNLPNYSFSRNTLKGLGGDLTPLVQAYTGGTLSSATNVTNAFGTALGLINQYGATYNFGIDGKAIPFGTSISRAFKDKEYEFYAQDSFKVRKDLTLTYGIRYSIYQPPYELNGVQVVPTTPLSSFFAARVGGQALGIPSFALPNAVLSYNLGGPVNNGADYYPTDKNNWAPRLGVAWAPDFDGVVGKLFGKGSVIRAGAGIVYDRYGSNIAVQFANLGSPGLATTVSQPVNTDFTTSFRYNGGPLPTIPSAVGGTFPLTPPTIVGGFTSFTGIASDLKAPYSYLLNLSYARPLTHSMSLEVGYIGRLSHAGILQQDFAQPLTQFKDPKSGQTWAQGVGALRALYDGGLTPAQVKANPSLVPLIPFIENMFPAAKNNFINGSASANYFFDTWGNNAGSELDGLNDFDRQRLPNGQCLSVTGCNTFFALQAAGVTSYANAGHANYQGLHIVLRRALTKGWGYDFNYTWSHSLDNSSYTEATIGSIQDSFNPNSNRGPSDFDIRHNVTANFVVELPVGKGKMFLSGAPKVVDAILGGWQVSSLVTLRSGTPYNVSNGGVYSVNYLSSAIGILKPGASMPASARFDQNGIPSIFANTNAVNSFVGEYPGTTGTRGILRGPSFYNTDISVSKYFRLPWEGHLLFIRAEAFNAFNNVNFLATAPNGATTGNLVNSLATPSTFGELGSAAEARVMQFALRYKF
jgi:Carboxypeptidase regulatory-like domain/TonB dependent receptor